MRDCIPAESEHRIDPTQDASSDPLGCVPHVDLYRTQGVTRFVLDRLSKLKYVVDLVGPPVAEL
ncbi:MAG TPA: hypothetical protein VEM93_02060 [Actinomycetota bacterium]|nr:hypothetical protein [Actinomycetota bacterium]